MNFFFDANMSRRYARMISELCEGIHSVIHITDHPNFIHKNKFSHNGKLIGNDTDDSEWVEKLGGSGIDITALVSPRARPIATP